MQMFNLQIHSRNILLFFHCCVYPFRDSISDTSLVSSSSKKLENKLSEYEKYDDNEEETNEIMPLSLLNGLINKIAKCEKCNGDVKISVSRRIGLASEILVKCLQCDECSQAVLAKKIISEGKRKLSQKYYLFHM